MKPNDVIINIVFVQETYAKELKVKVEEGEPEREAWKKLCINFLKGTSHDINNNNNNIITFQIY